MICDRWSWNSRNVHFLGFLQWHMQRLGQVSQIFWLLTPKVERLRALTFIKKKKKEKFFWICPCFFPKFQNCPTFNFFLQKCPTFSYTLVPLHLHLRGTLKSNETLSLLYPASGTCEVLFNFFFEIFICPASGTCEVPILFFFFEIFKCPASGTCEVPFIFFFKIFKYHGIFGIF